MHTAWNESLNDVRATRDTVLGVVDGVKRPEALDLDRVAARIAEEHCPLLARLALKPDLWLNNKLGVCLLQTARQRFPVREFEDRTEVGHRHHVVAHLARVGSGKRLAEVEGDLVAKKVEVDPRIGTATFLAPKDIPVEGASCVEVTDVVCEVEQAANLGCSGHCAGVERRAKGLWCPGPVDLLTAHHLCTL